MRNVNYCVLTGRLVKDPELRYTQGGTALCTFAIAVNRERKNQDGEYEEETSFVDIVCWQKLAELCSQYLGKGRLVLVEGRLNQQRWETQEGQKRNKIEIIANDVNFLDKPVEGNGNQSQPETKDDIPF